MNVVCLPFFFFFFSVSRPIRFLEGKVNPSGENPISYVPAAAFDYVIRRTKKLKWDVNYRPMCSTATGRTSLALCHTWRQRSRDDFKRLAYWLWLACFSLEDLIANMNGMIGIKSMTIYDNKCPLHYFQCDEIFLNTAIFFTQTSETWCSQGYLSHTSATGSKLILARLRLNQHCILY